MSKFFTYLIVSLALFSSTACDEFNTTPKQLKTYYGVQEDSQGITLRSININEKTSKTVARINDVKPLKKGVFSYNTQRDFFILGNETGVTVINVRTNDIVSNFEGISEVEYDKNADRVCGLTFDAEEGKWYFSHADHVLGNVSRVKQLNAFISVVPGSSTFDSMRNRYIFNSDRGLYVLDASTGDIIYTLQGVTNTEFNETDGRLIGLKSNNLRMIVEINPESPVITEIAEISGIGGVVLGASSFDPTNGNYIIETNLGVTVVKYETGEVVSSFSDILQLAVLDKTIPEIETPTSF